MMRLRAMLRRTVVAGLLAVVLAAHGDEKVFGQSASVTFTSFVTVDFPGAQRTALYKINNAGDAVGLYSISGVGGHGFLRSSGGAFSTIDPPGSSNTAARGINSLSQPVIVGPYALGTDGQHSFILAGGNYTSFDPTGATAINDLGKIVGTYLDASGVWHGFLRDVNGTITPIDVPGAAGTKAIGINNAGQIVGNYGDFITFSHGFIRDAAGSFTTFDFPGATFTEITAINNIGEIVGGFSGGAGGHGFFLRDASGALSTIDGPISSSIADLVGLNDSRGVAGTYIDSVGAHGFIGSLKLVPVLVVPKWFQAGIPSYDSQGIPMPGPDYPGLWGPKQYDFELDPKTKTTFTIQQHGCALTALTMLFNFWNHNFTSPTVSNPNTGLPPADVNNPLNPMMPNGWEGLFEPSNTGRVIWDDFGVFANTQHVRVYHSCSLPRLQLTQGALNSPNSPRSLLTQLLIPFRR